VVTRWRALGADGEPAALVEVDEIRVFWPRRARCPARLAVIPAGGAEAAADRLAGLIAALPGASRASGSALTTVLRASGGHPSRQGKPAIRLARSMPGSTAVAAVLTALLDALEANVPGTLADIDTEFLHDLRIAVRHTRSVLKLAAGALPSALAGRYGREFRWLGQLTGPTRDLDVFLLAYLRMESALIKSPAADLAPFREHLELLRASARRDLCRGLRSARFTRLSAGWRRALADAGGAGWPLGSPPAATLAASQLARAHRRVLREGRRLGPGSGPEELHELRKRCKELRYLADVYASLYDAAAHARAVASLKKLQDCLGEVQDTDTQQREIERFAGQLTATGHAPAGTLGAMRELGDILAARQQRARDQFARRFAEFSGERGRGAFLALTTLRPPVAAAG
jgi:CHAD domain-containing protein